MQQDTAHQPEQDDDEDGAPVTNPRFRAAHQAYSQAAGQPPRPQPVEPEGGALLDPLPEDEEEEMDTSELSAEDEALAFDLPEEEESDSPLVSELQAKVAEQHEHLLRLAAEMDNLRKRTEREKEEAGKYAVQKFAREMAQVAENLIRAVQSVGEEDKSASPALQNLTQGVEMTLDALLKAFEKEKIQRLYPEGEIFDHRFHQAISQADVPGATAGQVIQVVQAGYALHDRLLQPALVVVAKGDTNA